MEGFAEVTEELINEYLSFFGKNHVFSDAERTLLNRNWTQLVVKKNERVVTEGQKTLLWVEKGVLRIGKKDSRHEGVDCVYGLVFAGTGNGMEFICGTGFRALEIK